MYDVKSFIHLSILNILALDTQNVLEHYFQVDF